MSLSQQQIGELYDLLWGLRAGTATPQELARLERWVCEDREARTFYVRYMHLCADLHWNNAADGKSEVRNPKSEVSYSRSPVPNPTYIPPIVLDLSPAVHPSLAATLFTPGGFLFSYTVSALLVGIGLLVGWTWRISNNDRQVVGAQGAAAGLSGSAETPPVGRITGLIDCQWAGPAPETFDGADVPLGRRYALAAGFMEITYHTGARVILQGPVNYQVETASGGYLTLGRLTARVEKRGEERGDREERLANHQSEIISHEFPSPLSPLPSPLFSVRTPTTIVTDLGTEFGVEVDRSGASKAYVFRGKVEVRPIDGGVSFPSSSRAGGGVGGRAIRLGPNESATVEVGQGRAAKVLRGAGQSSPIEFVRHMPQRFPIRVFSTGVGLREGDPDPHWQIVAWSGDPEFKPQPAVVTMPATAYLENDPAKAQWISTAGNLPNLPPGRYTFRTTFDLAGAWPDSAVLQGRFIAENHVDTIRFNGQAVSAPQHGSNPPFDTLFRIRNGFAEGSNVLEIEVYNRPATKGSERTDLSADGKVKRLPPTAGTGYPMALLVELQGFAMGSPSLPAASADGDKAGTMKP